MRTEKQLRRDIGNRIRYLRKKKNLTQIELSKRTGVNNSHICFIENGEKFPSLFILNKIENVIGPVWLYI